jgi:RND family efflux transporter MFP subunit
MLMLKPRFYFETLSAAVAVCLFVTGCIVHNAAKELAETKGARSVKIVKPEMGSLVDNLAFIGFVEPKLVVAVHFLLSGRVEACLVKEGQVVKQGDEICRLDMSAVNLEVARTENSVEAARKVMQTNLPEKQKALFEAGVIGQSEFEQVRVQSEGAKAQHADAASLHEMAVKKRREHVLTAPWDGIVTRLLAKAGQPIVPEMPAAVLSDERSVQLGVDVHASYFGKLTRGAKGKITTVSSHTLDTPIPVAVIEKSIAVSPESQSFRVVLGPENADASVLTPGVLVTGELQVQAIDEVLRIPQAALISWAQSGDAAVFVVEEGKLVQKRIRTGVLAGGLVQVKEGLSVDSIVVSEPASDHVVGMSVRF